MLVGEIPGSDEDRQGRVFVGPAGKLLDRALADADLDRMDLYLTNAVKHFHFMMQRGIRLHKTPKTEHINACRPWLTAEVAAVAPRVLVCLGTTAARAVMGRMVTIKHERGVVQPHLLARQVLITVHPSAILRMPERETRHAEYRRFVNDLRLAKSASRSP
jgi:uracil-DNA glycosylase